MARSMSKIPFLPTAYEIRSIVVGVVVLVVVDDDEMGELGRLHLMRQQQNRYR